MAAVYLLPDAGLSGDLWMTVAIAAIFGIVNAYLRPIVKLLSLPLNLISFGVIGFIINVAMVLLTAFISGQLKLGFRLAGWPPGDITLDAILAAVLVAIIVGIVSAVLSLMRLVTPRI